jgi:hypothetical protein
MSCGLPGASSDSGCSHPRHGPAVRIPYSALHDLRGEQISALRIYFPVSLLVEQLTN